MPGLLLRVMVCVMVGVGLMACGDSEGGNATAGGPPGNANEDAFSAILATGFNEADPRLRGLQRLTDQEISQLVLGRTLVEDRPPGSGMPHPQGETFFDGGRVQVKVDRGLRVDGSYVVRDRALCVRRRSGTSYCRAFYRNAEGRTFQAFYGDGQITPIRFSRKPDA